jgi:hypothetical protein
MLKQAVYIVATGLQTVQLYRKPQDLRRKCIGYKIMFYSSLELQFETFFTLTNIYRVQFVVHAETRVDRRVKCVLLSGSNKTWSKSTDFS